MHNGDSTSDAIIITINTGYSLTHLLLDPLEQLFWQLLWTDGAMYMWNRYFLRIIIISVLPSGRSVAEQWLSTALLHPPGEREERKTKKEWKLSDSGRAALVVTVVEAVIMAKYMYIHCTCTWNVNYHEITMTCWHTTEIINLLLCVWPVMQRHWKQ